MLIAGLLEKLIAVVEGGGSASRAPSAAPNAVPTPALPSPSRPDRKHFSPK